MRPKSFLRNKKSRFSTPLLATSVITVSFLGALAQAGEHTYRYFRYNPTAITGAMQLSEFAFYLRGEKLNIQAAGTTAQSTGVGTPTTVTISGGTNVVTAAEGANKLIDGDVGTKMYSASLAVVNFDFGAPVTIDSYALATANDSLGRTPTTWTFEGSTDGTTWNVISISSDANNANGSTVYGEARLYNSFFTYQNIFQLKAVTGVPTISNIVATTPAIIPTGGSVNMNYTTTGTPTSVILNPGNVDITSTPNFTVSPTQSTTYTITATGTGGSVSKAFDVRVVTPETATYRYVRFTPLKTRVPTSTLIQVAEVSFYSGSTLITGITATNPGGFRGNAAEGPEKLVDGSNTSKWLDEHKQPVVFDFGSVKSFDSYEMVTGNDATDRDPVRWLLEGSTDGSEWTTIQLVGNNDYPIPTARTALTGKIPLSYTPQVWTGSVSSEWNTVATNFAGPAAYTAGTAALFNDTAANKTVNLTAPLTPSSIGITTNSAYTIAGSYTSGQGSIIKNGSGTATLSNLNSTDGAIIINKGKLISSAVKALGETNANGRLFIRGGGQLEVTSNQFSQRQLNVDSAGISVTTGAKYTQTGPIKLNGTLTKTGVGTLALGGTIGSYNSPGSKLLVNEGIVEFTSDHFNRAIFGGNRLTADVAAGATLRGTVGNAFGGDYGEYQVGINQFRISGTLEHASGIQYYPAGIVTTNGVAQGRIVLKGGAIVGSGVIESSRSDSAAANLDGTNAYRAIISTEASAIGSTMTGSGALTLNPAHILFDVAEGAALEDLLVSKVINGNYGIIKEGKGNLTLTGTNTYTGRAKTYIASIDNPTAIPNFDQSLASAKAFDLPHGTTVRDGTLTVSNATGSGTGASPVLVMAPATLAGTGTLAGAVTVNGTVAPGDVANDWALATLKTGSLTINGGYTAEVNGLSHDLLEVTGDLAINGSLQVVSTGAGLTESVVIAKYTGTRTGTFTGVPSNIAVTYDDAAKEVRVAPNNNPVTGYDAFIAGTTLTGADALATADPDGDGLSNLIEFVLGGNPQTSSTAEAPTLTTTGTGDKVFTFRRTAASAYLNPAAEYSTTLGGSWTTVPAENVTVESNGFAQGVDKVTVTLPAGLSADGKLFVRVKAVL